MSSGGRLATPCRVCMTADDCLLRSLPDETFRSTRCVCVLWNMQTACPCLAVGRATWLWRHEAWLVTLQRRWRRRSIELRRRKNARGRASERSREGGQGPPHSSSRAASHDRGLHAACGSEPCAAGR